MNRGLRVEIKYAFCLRLRDSGRNAHAISPPRPGREQLERARMTPRILVVEAERELRVWLRHHIEILWPDATVVEMEPQQLQVASSPQTSSTTIDLVLLGAHCEESPEL